jgi:hypothetical protein
LRPFSICYLEELSTVQNLKIVYPICCGVDVHKSFPVAAVITAPAGNLLPRYQKKRFLPERVD